MGWRPGVGNIATYTEGKLKTKVLSWVDLYGAQTTFSGTNITATNTAIFSNAASIQASGSITLAGTLSSSAAAVVGGTATFTNGTSLVTSGNVGIGTNSPDYELDVAGDIGVNEYIYHNGDADTYIRFDTNLVNLVAGGKSAIKYEASTGKIVLNNTNENVDVHIMAEDNTELLTTDAANNRVGIGTTAPEAYLDIKNIVDDGATNRTMLRLHNYRTDDADVNDFGPISIDFVIENLGGGTKTGTARIAAVSSPVGTDHTAILGEKTSALIFSTMNDDTLAEAMRINAAGNVGIGVTDPDSLLEVFGTSTQLKLSYDATDFATFTVDTNHDLTITPSDTGQIKLQPTTDSTDFFQVLDADGGTPILNIDSTNERVGIGTSSPDYALDVAGNIGLNEYIYHNGDSNTYIRFTTDDINITVGGVNMMDFTEGASDSIVFNEAGADLDFRVESNGQANMFVIDGGDDRIGIGTGSPMNRLHIKHAGGDGDNGLLISRLDATTVTDEILGGIGFDSEDGNVPSSILEASAYIAAFAAEAHTTGDKGGYLTFGTAPIDQNDDTASSERVRILNDGKIGIATTTPKNILQIDHTGADGDDGLMIVRADATTVQDNILGGIGFDSTDGNVPSTVLEASAYIAAFASETHTTSDKGGYMVFGTSATNDNDDTTSHERMRISHSGHVGINKDTPNSLLHIYSTLNINADSNYSTPIGAVRIEDASDSMLIDSNQIERTGDGTLYVQYNSAGNFDAVVGGGSARKPSGGSWTATSDRRVKKDIIEFVDGLDVLAQLSPIKYKYNGKGGLRDNGKEYIGMVAQDVEAHAPYMVWQEKELMNPDDTEETDIYQFDPSALVYICLNAIKELKQRIEELEGSS